MTATRSRAGRAITACVVACLVAAGCAGPSVDSSPTSRNLPDGIADRLAALEAAVDAWGAAPSLTEARAAAEEARNLVVGPHGPLYGDADGDGTLGGASNSGLLPGLDGSPELAGPPPANDCVEADVLGGPWADPEERWATMLDAIDAWAPDANTFPGLPSHPQRVVGWAALALDAEDLAEAREYAGHAALHVAVTRTAYGNCA